MIVFAVAGTRNQHCPPRSTRNAPSSRPSTQAPRTSQPSAFTLSRTRSSASSNAAAHGAEASGSRQTATSPASASSIRAGTPARSMDEQDADCETAMGPLPWLGFLQKRHPTRLRRAERSRLRPRNPPAVTKSRPRNPDCHRSAPKAIGNERKISINQTVTIAIRDLRPAKNLTVGRNWEIVGSVITKIEAQKSAVEDDLDLSDTKWLNMYLGEANINGILKLGECNNDGVFPEFLSLRGTYIGSISDSKCNLSYIKKDLFGWRYDGIAMSEILAREEEVKELLKWLSPNKEVKHYGEVALPKLYLADRLEELGMIEKANNVRIAERRDNLQQLIGIDGWWQWALGEITGFGYKPQTTIYWFVGLVVVGFFMLLASWSDRGRRMSEKYPRLFFMAGAPWIGFTVVLVAIVLEMYGGALTLLGWDLVGYGLIAVIVFTFLWGAWGSPKMNLRGERMGSAEQCGSSASSSHGLVWGRYGWVKVKWGMVKEGYPDAKAAAVYSFDRAVPFLGFDNEHVHWFPDPTTGRKENGQSEQEEGEKLKKKGAGRKRWINDIPVLGIYFYVHSLAGFGLISLFVAGLTGVLK